MVSYFAYRVGDGLRPTVGDIDVSFHFASSDRSSGCVNPVVARLKPLLDWG
ncbi:hypothetical protein [Desmonostoc muscorum]|uniref:Uncharacterized protein n=1 Tax=Desmonostoc muscorum LEGE 12446 TaxID=1828758 RepID=A0A8J7D2A2_DESMC|nr:hypothetical protein [Desmonostoc muscorum]